MIGSRRGAGRRFALADGGRAALALVAGLACASSVPGAPACTPRLQVFFAADFNDQPYQRKAYQAVASSWKRPGGNRKAGGKAVVIVTIARDGKATPPVLHHESGSGAWDAAAVEAVKKASPFDPLPKGYAGPSVEVHFHFECPA